MRIPSLQGLFIHLSLIDECLIATQSLASLLTMFFSARVTEVLLVTVKDGVMVAWMSSWENREVVFIGGRWYQVRFGTLR